MENQMQPLKKKASVICQSDETSCTHAGEVRPRGLVDRLRAGSDYQTHEIFSGNVRKTQNGFQMCFCRVWWLAGSSTPSVTLVSRRTGEIAPLQIEMGIGLSYVIT